MVSASSSTEYATYQGFLKMTSAEINEWDQMGLNQVLKVAPVISSISKVLRSGWIIRHIVPDHADKFVLTIAATGGASVASEVE